MGLVQKADLNKSSGKLQKQFEGIYKSGYKQYKFISKDWFKRKKVENFKLKKKLKKFKTIYKNGLKIIMNDHTDRY